MRPMKSSGIEWLGEIPENWEMKRLKAVLVERNEKNDPIKSDNILSLGANYGVIPYSEKVGGGNKAKEDLCAYKLAYPNDIVMNSMNIVSGAVALSQYYGCVSPVYYMFYPRYDNISINYYNMIFQSKVFQRSLIGLGNGILMKESENGNLNTVRMRIPLNKLNALILPVPPIYEQLRIADYLEKKVKEIDNAINRIFEEIEEYKKFKQSIISNSVFFGIKDDVNYKNSNISWISKIPAHWNVQKTSVYFKLSKGLPITKDNLKETGIPVVSYGQIHAKWNSGVHLHEELKRFVDRTYELDYPQCRVKIGSIIMADTSEDLLGCGNIAYNDNCDNLFAGYHTIVLSSDSVNNKYFAYLFQTDLWRSQIRQRVSGVKLFSVTQKILKDTTILVPPFKEQIEITSYLDEKCNTINSIIDGKMDITKELEEYKKSLIFEFVTGKKTVREG